MIAYRTARAVSLALRSVQTALLRTEFAVSDAADKLGDLAKVAAKRAIDRKIEAGYNKVDDLWTAAGAAEACASDASDAWACEREDHLERLRQIEREVL